MPLFGLVLTPAAWLEAGDSIACGSLAADAWCAALVLAAGRPPADRGDPGAGLVVTHLPGRHAPPWMAMALMGGPGRQFGGQVGSHLLQGLPIGVPMVFQEAALWLRRCSSLSTRRGHRQGRHAGGPALGQQYQQLPGIPAWAGNRSCRVRALCTAAGSDQWSWPVAAPRAALGQLLLPLRQLPRQIVDHLQNEPCSSGVCATGPDTGRAGPDNAGHGGKPAELADGHPETG